MKRLIKLLTIGLLICLTASCITTKIEVESKVLIFPVAPLLPDVHFENTQNGVFLDYNDGRILAVFLNDYKMFLEKYEIAVEYNRGNEDG